MRLPLQILVFAVVTVAVDSPSSSRSLDPFSNGEHGNLHSVAVVADVLHPLFDIVGSLLGVAAPLSLFRGVPHRDRMLAAHGGRSVRSLNYGPPSFFTWFESRFMRLLQTVSQSSVMVGSAI